VTINPCGAGSGTYAYTNTLFNYAGEWKNGIKDGAGKFLIGNGVSYEGAFKSGEIQGNGLRRWPDGAFYCGHVWPKGASYSGQFNLGELEGHGTFIGGEGGPIKKYEGAWLRNRKHGEGEMTFADRSKYKGTFVDNKEHGKGTLTCRNGDKYVGLWATGKRNGSGKATFKDGSHFDGEWKENQRHGDGLDFDSASGMQYSGNWNEDVPTVTPTRLRVKNVIGPPAEAAEGEEPPPENPDPERVVAVTLTAGTPIPKFNFEFVILDPEVEKLQAEAAKAAEEAAALAALNPEPEEDDKKGKGKKEDKKGKKGKDEPEEEALPAIDETTFNAVTWESGRLLSATLWKVTPGVDEGAVNEDGEPILPERQLAQVQMLRRRAAVDAENRQADDEIVESARSAVSAESAGSGEEGEETEPEPTAAEAAFDRVLAAHPPAEPFPEEEQPYVAAEFFAELVEEVGLTPIVDQGGLMRSKIEDTDRESVRLYPGNELAEQQGLVQILDPIQPEPEPVPPKPEPADGEDAEAAAEKEEEEPEEIPPVYCVTREGFEAWHTGYLSSGGVAMIGVDSATQRTTDGAGIVQGLMIPDNIEGAQHIAFVYFAVSCRLLISARNHVCCFFADGEYELQVRDETPAGRSSDLLASCSILVGEQVEEVDTKKKGKKGKK
jgi:hypothetical protein